VKYFSDWLGPKIILSQEPTEADGSVKSFSKEEAESMDSPQLISSTKLVPRRCGFS